MTNPIRHYITLVETAMAGRPSSTPQGTSVEEWVSAIMETSGGQANWKWVETTPERYLADFTLPVGKRNIVNIEYTAVFWADGDGSWEFRWGNKVDNNGKFNVNVTGYGNSIPVFRTIHSILQAFIIKAKPTKLYFATPSREDNNRARLYRRMANAFASSHGGEVSTYTDDDSTEFMIEFGGKQKNKTER